MMKAQIAQSVKEYSARVCHNEDDPSHRALIARLREGMKRLLEGGHRPPPAVLAKSCELIVSSDFSANQRRLQQDGSGNVPQKKSRSNVDAAVNENVGWKEGSGSVRKAAPLVDQSRYLHDESSFMDALRDLEDDENDGALVTYVMDEAEVAEAVSLIAGFYDDSTSTNMTDGYNRTAYFDDELPEMKAPLPPVKPRHLFVEAELLESLPEIGTEDEVVPVQRHAKPLPKAPPRKR